MFERGVARAQHANPQAIPIVSMKMNDKAMLIGGLGQCHTARCIRSHHFLMHPFCNLAPQTYPHSLANDINRHTRIGNWGIATPLMH